MKNIEIIKKLKSSAFTDEDGENYTLDFKPGLTTEDIEKLKLLFPNNTIDNELIEILKETRGWEDYGLDDIDFSSIGQFGFTELCPHSVTLGHDGFGNHWVLDISNDGSLGHVYYACHDPAVFIRYADDLNGFLSSLLEFHESPAQNYLNDIHDNIVYDIWENNGLFVDKIDFEKGNTSYFSFLNQLEDNDWVIADLRNAKNKTGFAWGKFGPNSEIKRHPKELIWGIKKSKKGFFKRLFGN
ncbi:SMI1/KNR4 family protein [Winogradskyella helgolandensis]|uniref:SMI1/KNR4 family protein n=1 Tax=Winogradskyella helgolandensis TaxID=2697010 RepID=UPI0015BAA169|nr:SMI1/KNR4 family protein [Winogradskyella helgolandensis]